MKLLIIVLVSFIVLISLTGCITSSGMNYYGAFGQVLTYSDRNYTRTLGVNDVHILYQLERGRADYRRRNRGWKKYRNRGWRR